MYTRNLLPELMTQKGSAQITAYVSPEAYDSLCAEQWAEELTVKRVGVGGASRALRIAAENTVLPAHVRQDGIDLLHSLGNSAPTFCAVASVVTIHDLIFKHYPQAHSRMMRMGQSVVVPLAVHRADHIIAVSQATRDDIVETYRVPARKIDVVHQGCSPVSAEATDSEELRHKFDLPAAPLIFSPSAKRAHKNLARLIEAFAQIELDPAPLLVIPGYPTPYERYLKQLARDLGVESRVRFYGWLESADMEGFYRVSECFVFPSLFEGFGLPVLESMSRSLAVTCADINVLREVAGEAARYFDPYSVESIAGAITAVLTDEHERRHLVEAGLRQSSKFTWRATATGTLAVYQNALGGNPIPARATDA